MSQVAIVKPNQVTEASQWTPEQMRLITEVVARGASPDELKLFLYRCNKMGLDPLKPGQVHFIKYGTSPGTIVVGIEGFRSIAGRTGKVSGVKRGVTKEEGKLVSAWCEVHRSDWQHPAREEVPFAEYTTGKGPWAKMPETMLKKVAEAAALRMAFPDDLGGVYTVEEMDQAKTDAPRIAAGADQPTAEDGVLDDGVYRIPFGKYVKRSLHAVSPRDLASYIDYLEGAAIKKGQPLAPVVLEFIDKASRHIAAMERGEITS
jgi:phage recombination protein Bet